jgi:hypothetical protein
MGLHELFAVFELHDDVILNSESLKLILQLLEFLLALFHFVSVLIGSLHVDIQEQVEIDLFFELKLRVILYFFLFLYVEPHSIQLEHHHVRGPTNPSLHYFLLSWSLSLESTKTLTFPMLGTNCLLQ